MTLQTGQIVDDKYRIVRVLGKGGMGAVYEGENTRIHRRVAIKVLLAEVANKADIVQRFEREAQAAGRIGSEHIVEVLDLGSLPTGERYMVMEFLDGEALGDRIKRVGRIPAADCAYILEQLLEGLGAAHDAGIIHRDLKPDNVFLVRGKGGSAARQHDFVKIVDFGVSKFSSSEETFSMTRTGAVMGTPYYMSPEQARGQKIDHRSDLYSVGVVGYQMLTGRVPFNADTFNELLFKIALESPEPAELHAPGLDPAFSAIIARGMARDVAQRFGSAKEFAHAIAGWRARTSGVSPQVGYPSLGAGAGSHGGFGQAHGAYPSQGAHPSQSGPGSWPGAQSSPGGSHPSHPSLLQSSPPYGGHPQVQLANTPVPHSAPSSSGYSQPYGPAPVLNPAMNQSQVAVALATAPPAPKKSNGWIAIVGVMAALGIGGGIAAYKFVGTTPASTGANTAAATNTATPAAPDKTEPPRASAELPATTAPPASSLSGGPVASSGTADPVESAAPSASVVTTTPVNPPPNNPGLRFPPPPSTTPGKPPPPPHAGGRPITGDL